MTHTVDQRTADKIRALFPNASEAFLRANRAAVIAHFVPKDKPRMRQNRKGLNKTEAAFRERLRAIYPNAISITPHVMTFEIASGCRYTPDFIVDHGSSFSAFEVKGPHAWDDAIVKLKVAARSFPGIQFWLASRARAIGSSWRIERVFP